MLQVSGLFIYPVKSLGGVSVSSARVTARGLENDRRWLLVDEHGRFMTQRENHQMALLQVGINAGGLTVRHKQLDLPELEIPYGRGSTELIRVQIWEDSCMAQLVDTTADTWFSAVLGKPCQLVYMPDSTERKVDPKYAFNAEITSFSDAFPTLIIGQSSLDDLNQRLDSPVPMNRFRPNIVFTGGEAFEEDQLASFYINGTRFEGVKPCARCVITTIDQETALAGKDPLRTLAAYRTRNNKVMFGVNLLHQDNGIIHVGDELIRH